MDSSDRRDSARFLRRNFHQLFRDGEAGGLLCHNPAGEGSHFTQRMSHAMRMAFDKILLEIVAVSPTISGLATTCCLRDLHLLYFTPLKHYLIRPVACYSTDIMAWNVGRSTLRLGVLEHLIKG